MATPSIQTLRTDAQQVLNLDSISAVRSVVAATLANANAGTPLNPNLTTQQLWNEFYQIITQPKSDIESIIANQLMKFMYAPPAPGGAGADKQVIFNDGGVLAGDPQFLWNKTTNLLTVTGSATITGDLTVATDRLKVTGGNVGIGTATPTNYANYTTLTINGTNGGEIDLTDGGTLRGQLFSESTGLTLAAVGGLIKFGAGTGGTEKMRIDSSGNLGLGVTPSAWVTGSKAFQLGNGGSIFNNTDSTIQVSQNGYVDSGGWKYIANGYASNYFQYQGQHIWRNAASGTAGNAITFAQVMTLDASGNLLVGKTSSSLGVVGVEARPNGEVWSTNAASTDGAGSSYILYSTGATAYRFYVGMGGTVFATNTTISAISDARLKENVQDIDVGLGAILALKPRKFDWKAGKGKDIKGDRGFIAQEFETVFPNLIDEWKDEAPEGEAPYKSVRQDLIPVLVKAIQELTARVQTLETR
jgi:hypothetical protein